MTTHGISRRPGASATRVVDALRQHGKLNDHEVALFHELRAYKKGQTWTRAISALEAALLLAGQIRAC
jgi:hypothetical protein